MREPRWPWIVTSVLLLAAAVVAAWSTYLYWLPCRGTLLSGSLLRGYQYGPDFSDACLRQMDGPSEQTPWATELVIVAMTLTGAAWLILVLGMRWSLRTKAVAALPGLTTLMLAAVSAVVIADPAHRASDYVSGWLLVTPEVAALVALVAISGWQPEVHGRYFGRLLVVAWGTTAFGLVHMIAEYMLMIAFSDANWDTPPLTGSVTVMTLILSAVLTLVLTLRPRPLNSAKDLSQAARSQG